MIKNGLYALNATSRDGMSDDVGGVLILRDGEMLGGDAFVFYTGSYECSAIGHWQGKMTSQEHTPTGRPIAARVQHIGFLGTYNDAGAKVDAIALVGDQSVRYDATLRLLLAFSRSLDHGPPATMSMPGRSRNLNEPCRRRVLLSAPRAIKSW